MSTVDVDELKKFLEDNYLIGVTAITLADDGIGSSTYIVGTKGTKYVAKVLPSYSSIEAVEFQDFLHNKQLPVPAVVPNSSGQLLTKMGNAQIVLNEFCSGQAIGWSDDTRFISQSLSEDLAAIVARMHSYSVSENRWHGNSSNKITSAELSELNRSKIRKAMIHGDLTRDNVLISASNEKVTAIIDFADAHYDFITYDIAILLTQIYVSKTWGIDFAGIKDFMQEYVKHSPLNHDELKSIVPLMKARNILLKKEVARLQAKGNNRELESIKQSAQSKIEAIESNMIELNKLVLNS